MMGQVQVVVGGLFRSQIPDPETLSFHKISHSNFKFFHSIYIYIYIYIIFIFQNNLQKGLAKKKKRIFFI